MRRLAAASPAGGAVIVALGWLLLAAPVGSGQPVPPATRQPLRLAPRGHQEGEVLVKFKPGAKPVDRQRSHGKADAERVSAISRLGIERVKSRRGESTAALLELYRQDPNVEYAEPNGFFYAAATPDDPLFPDQYGLHNSGQGGGLVDADVDATEAWDLVTGSGSVVIANIDSGVNLGHEDLWATQWLNPGESAVGNGIDDDGNGFIDDRWGWNFVDGDALPLDDYWHGTHTQGTIAATGNNGVGVTGVAWQARVMALKFLDATGHGTWEHAAAAILYAADNGAKVVNNSYGCLGCFSQAVEDAIAYTNSRGVLFVAAAMNDGNDNDVTPAYPCASSQPNVLCVAATDRNDQLASFSNYGATTVDLGAPGVAR